MKTLQKYILYIAWFQALVATVGSLFFSEVLHLPPCILCWYQRICMYPLTILLAVGLLTEDKNVVKYALPLSGIGMGIAAYHSLLYYHILPESIVPCTAGVSCTTRYFSWLGFITIPLLSLMAFTIITVCLLILLRKFSKNKSTTEKVH